MIVKKILSLLFSGLLFCSTAFGGVEFDGADDEINCGNDSSLELHTNFTLSLWVYIQTDNVGFERIMSKTSKIAIPGSNDVDYWVQLNDDDTIQVAIRNDAGGVIFLNSSSALSAGQWYHILTTKDSTEFQIFINGGTADATGITSGTMADIVQRSSTSLYLAHLSDNGSSFYNFNAIINEVAIWDVVSSQNEVDLLAKAKVKGMPLQIQPSSLVMYLPLDDQPDGTSFDGDTAVDRSGNSNDGVGDNGGNNSGLTATAESVLSYP